MHMLKRGSLVGLLAFAYLALLLILASTTPSAQNAQLLFLGSNNGGPQPASAVELARMPTSQTTTARNLSSVLMAEKGSRWVATSNPASGSQATASIAAEAAVRHVADCVTFSADASAAVAAAAGTVVIRDGATGAGTVLATFAVAHQVAAGAGVQTVAPLALCGLNLVGTTNTAMTAEFNAGVTGEVQAANLTGFNVQ